MQVGRVATAFLALAAVACTERAEMLPVNGTAQSSGAPVFTFARGFAGGVLNIKMPDGESLPGKFSISEVAGGPDGGGNFAASASGPRTAMTCRGSMSAGHGPVECRDNTGAIYRMTL